MKKSRWVPQIDFAAIVKKAMESGEWPLGEYIHEVWQGPTVAGTEIYEALQLHIWKTYPGGLRCEVRADLDVVWLRMTLEAKGEESLLEQIFMEAAKHLRAAEIAFRRLEH